MKEIVDLMNEIGNVQDGQDLSCSCTECYWNMFNPNSKNFNNDKSKVCVSESLADFKMEPNSLSCEGYWSFEEACGRKKADG